MRSNIPTATEVARINALFPLMAALGSRWQASKPFEGHIIAWNCHLTSLTAVSALALVKGGGQWVVSAANPATTDPGVVSFMRQLGMEVFTGENGDRHLMALARKPEILADVGLDLIGAALDRAPECLEHVVGGIEITASGVLRMAGRAFPFPLININDGELKPAIENHHGVGEGTWQALSFVTGKHPAGRRVVVLGYGAVGKGVAQYGRAAGASVEVVEVDPIRRLKAHYDGFPTPPLSRVLAEAGIVVSATGRSGVVTAEALASGKGDVVVANVGHWGDEIDVAGLARLCRPEPMGPDLKRYELGPERAVYVVTSGEPVNIVLNTGSPEPTLLHLALEGLTVEHLLGEGRLASPGVHLVPRGVESVAAELALGAL